MYKEPGVLIIPYPMGTEAIIPVGPARIQASEACI